MDAATMLVRLYLHVNGYFTVTEYPVIEMMRRDDVRTVTDVDVLAVRLPGSRRIVPHHGGKRADDVLPFEVDPELVRSDDRIDMLIAEVKEGQIELNRGAREPNVLRAVLRRFGGLERGEIDSIVQRLLAKGEAVAASGPRVRLAAFGSYHGKQTGTGFQAITIRHVLDYLEPILSEHWDHLRYLQVKDPAFNFMMLLEKARQSEA